VQIGPWMPAAPPARHWCHPTDLGFRLPPLGASEKQHPQPVEARKTPGAHGPRGPRSIVRAPAPLEGQRMRPRGGLLSCRRGPVRWPAALLPPLNATGPPRKLGHTDLATAGSRQKHPAALFPSWPPIRPGLGWRSWAVPEATGSMRYAGRTFGRGAQSRLGFRVRTTAPPHKTPGHWLGGRPARLRSQRPGVLWG
jgi:hypothetical protein